MPDMTPESMAAALEDPAEELFRAARRIEGDISDAVFEELCGGGRNFRLPPGMLVEDLSGTKHADLYDPEVWPLVLVDAAGQRFEIDVQVFVQALPSVDAQARRHAAEAARLARLLEARQARAATEDDRTDRPS
jgi:hypothetical protein